MALRLWSMQVTLPQALMGAAGRTFRMLLFLFNLVCRLRPALRIGFVPGSRAGLNAPHAIASLIANNL